MEEVNQFTEIFLKYYLKSGNTKYLRVLLPINVFYFKYGITLKLSDGGKVIPLKMHNTHLIFCSRGNIFPMTLNNILLVKIRYAIHLLKVAIITYR